MGKDEKSEKRIEIKMMGLSVLLTLDKIQF